VTILLTLIYRLLTNETTAEEHTAFFVLLVYPADRKERKRVKKVVPL
jgi:hypothetical protein